LCHRDEHEDGNEQADAPIGNQRAREYDRKHHAALSQPFRHEISDGRHGTAVLHELAEYRAEQEQRKELGQKACSAAHENLRPVGEQGFAAEERGDERSSRRQ
jgi:hypothetical protein